MATSIHISNLIRFLNVYQNSVYNATNIPIISTLHAVKEAEVLNSEGSISRPLDCMPFLPSFKLIKYIPITHIRKTNPILSTKGIS